MMVQLWGGQRDGEHYDFAEQAPPRELNVSPIDRASDGEDHLGEEGDHNNVIALVYKMTEEFMSDGSQKFKYDRSVYREILFDPSDPDLNPDDDWGVDEDWIDNDDE